MVLPVHFQYMKEEHAGRHSVTLCAAFLDCGRKSQVTSAAREKGFMKANLAKMFRNFYAISAAAAADDDDV